MDPSSSAGGRQHHGLLPPSATVGQLPVPGPGADRRGANRSSATWTSSSGDLAGLSDTDDVQDRLEYVREYNRLARKHGIRMLVPEDYIQSSTEFSPQHQRRGWFSRTFLRQISSASNASTARSERKASHKRSVSDLAKHIVHATRRDILKDEDIQSLVRLCGKSILYLPSEYAPCSLVLPTCFRATAQYLVQHAADTRGVFRIPGSVRTVNALYDYYCAEGDVDVDEISSTIRCPNLPLHIKVSTHDVASTFKRLLSGLPGGILGSLSLFDALVAIQSQLRGDAEFMRTKQTKLRARLIALAVGSVRSQFRRELICAVFGLLCLIGRSAETAPREDDHGRPLPTGDLMGYSALGIVFGPLLVGDLINSYTMRLAHPSAGLLLFPVTPPNTRREKRKSKLADEQSPRPLTVDKIHVANGITEMLITHWREAVKHMKSLEIMKSSTDGPSIVEQQAARKASLRPSASESFVIRKPAEWSGIRPPSMPFSDSFNPVGSPVPPSPTPEAQEPVLADPEATMTSRGQYEAELGKKYQAPLPTALYAAPMEEPRRKNMAPSSHASQAENAAAYEAPGSKLARGQYSRKSGRGKSRSPTKSSLGEPSTPSHFKPALSRQGRSSMESFESRGSGSRAGRPQLATYKPKGAPGSLNNSPHQAGPSKDVFSRGLGSKETSRPSLKETSAEAEDKSHRNAEPSKIGGGGSGKRHSRLPTWKPRPRSDKSTEAIRVPPSSPASGEFVPPIGPRNLRRLFIHLSRSGSEANQPDESQSQRSQSNATTSTRSKKPSRAISDSSDQTSPKGLPGGKRLSRVQQGLEKSTTQEHPPSPSKIPVVTTQKLKVETTAAPAGSKPVEDSQTKQEAEDTDQISPKTPPPNNNQKNQTEFNSNPPSQSTPDSPSRLRPVKSVGSAVKAMTALFESAAASQDQPAIIPTPMQKINNWADFKPSGMLSQYTVNPPPPSPTKSGGGAIKTPQQPRKDETLPPETSNPAPALANEAPENNNNNNNNNNTLPQHQHQAEEATDHHRPYRPLQLTPSTPRQISVSFSADTVEENFHAPSPSLPHRPRSLTPSHSHSHSGGTPSSPTPSATGSTSSNAALYAQISALKKHIEDQDAEIRRLRRQLMDLRGAQGQGGQMMDVAALTKLLRETERECKMWRERAETAERRVKLFERLSERMRRLREEHGGAAAGSTITPVAATSAGDGKKEEGGSGNNKGEEEDSANKKGGEGNNNDGEEKREDDDNDNDAADGGNNLQGGDGEFDGAGGGGDERRQRRRKDMSSSELPHTEDEEGFMSRIRSSLLLHRREHISHGGMDGDGSSSLGGEEGDDEAEADDDDDDDDDEDESVVGEYYFSGGEEEEDMDNNKGKKKKKKKKKMGRVNRYFGRGSSGSGEGSERGEVRLSEGAASMIWGRADEQQQQQQQRGRGRGRGRDRGDSRTWSWLGDVASRGAVSE
ncbi:hypothetical protein B0T19DRAFT_475584 [Cercophora scortea]|uniref:Rho-GAP domain-containing protein n=1 Tax=Cercophora scortea TaxID=314031 RepID=A0AAE0IMU2_9PEZI|nr:hypothetical protein B0T19DRAFT_475584 [Cercophora scortea]